MSEAIVSSMEEQSLRTARSGNQKFLMMPEPLATSFGVKQAVELHGQCCFTPPTHVMAAFQQALIEHAVEDGGRGQYRRYRLNYEALVQGMAAPGFESQQSFGNQAPIIVTFSMPADERFDFKAFYGHLARRGYVIYPGKLRLAPSFLIDGIGEVTPEDRRRAVAAVREVLVEMGVEDCGWDCPGSAPDGLVKPGGNACHQ